MACGSSCCGPPRDALAATPAPDEDSCCDAEAAGPCNTSELTSSRREVLGQSGSSCSRVPVSRVSREAVVRKGSGSEPEQGCCEAPTAPGTEVLGHSTCGDREAGPCCALGLKAPEADGATAQNGCKGKAGGASFPTLESAECNAYMGCCSAPKQQDIEGGNTNRCSEPSATKTEDANNPSCCEGKASPCCDETCLDRIALRECDVSSGTPLTKPPSKTLTN